jgi:hypothetical protein
MIKLLSATFEKWKEATGGKADIEILEKSLRQDKRLASLDPKRVNFHVWLMIVLAKIFEIPKKKTKNCINNIANQYFPKINEKLQLQLHPTTTEEELKFIWDDIQRIQKIYIPNLDTRKKFEYPMHDADKKVYELKKTTEKSDSTIAREMREMRLIPENQTFTYIEVGKAARRYKKFIDSAFS